MYTDLGSATYSSDQLVCCCSVQGYALTGHCLVLLLTAILDHMGSPGMFYLLWIIFGGLTSLKLVRATSS